ncbi:DUF4834 family protein [Viscerimonas tarda]
MSFIFFFLFIILIIVSAVLSIGASFLRMLFGKPGTRQDRGYQQYSRSNQSQQNPAQHKKVFDKNEGEYVDYEEVK